MQARRRRVRRLHLAGCLLRSRRRVLIRSPSRRPTPSATPTRTHTPGRSTRSRRRSTITGGKPSDPSNSRSPTFTFTASEPTQCKLDGEAFAACTSPKGYSNLADGEHTFTVKATDAAGNTGAGRPHVDDRRHRTDRHDHRRQACQPDQRDLGQLLLHRQRRRPSASSTAASSPPAPHRRPTPASPTGRTPSR